MAFLKKLSQEESKRLSDLLENTCKDHEAEGYGLVFRTNAGAVPETELCEDIELVQKEYRALKKTGNIRMPEIWCTGISPAIWRG